MAGKYRTTFIDGKRVRVLKDHRANHPRPERPQHHGSIPHGDGAEGMVARANHAPEVS